MIIKPKSTKLSSFSISRKKFGVVRDGTTKNFMNVSKAKTGLQKRNTLIKVIKKKIKDVFKIDNKYVSLAKRMKSNNRTTYEIADYIDLELSDERKYLRLSDTVAVALKRAGYNPVDIVNTLRYKSISVTQIVSILDSLFYTHDQIKNALKQSEFKSADVKLALDFLSTLK